MPGAPFVASVPSSSLVHVMPMERASVSIHPGFNSIRSASNRSSARRDIPHARRCPTGGPTGRGRDRSAGVVPLCQTSGVRLIVDVLQGGSQTFGRDPGSRFREILVPYWNDGSLVSNRGSSESPGSTHWVPSSPGFPECSQIRQWLV